MRIFLAAFGRRLDIEVEFGTDRDTEEPDQDERPMIFYGSVESTPIGFCPSAPIQLEEESHRWAPEYDDD